MTADPGANTRPAPESVPAQMSHRQILVVFSGLGLGMLLAALDQTIVSTALWTIVKDIGGSEGLEHMSWLVTAYLLTSTASTPLYGKISDLYGRRPVYMFAIAMFLLGSVLAGFSQNMWQLIGTRAIQGVGAGGLMALTFAIIGDVVSPRERGRYQGYFGAVFALASVAGPLLGGFFTDAHSLLGIETSWRWVFYINLPLGLIALVVTSFVLNIPVQRRDHHIDYLGAALLVAGVSALLLVTVWGGQSYAWDSPVILGLVAGGLVLLALFGWHEARESEPILPLGLFRNPVFSVANAIGFILGLAMFGGIIFLPLYLQIVDGASPTESGLRMLPLMAGILTTSIVSGRLITRIGRYKVFPILGTGLTAFGLWLLSHLGAETEGWVLGLYMFVLGAGMGLVMQVLVLAIQNAVPHSELGVATSAATFFRSMGGAFGTAAFGAILSNRIASYLPAGAAAGEGGTPNPAQIALLPPQAQAAVVDAFVRALNVVFLSAAAAVLVAFALSWFLKELHLRSRGEPHLEEAAPAPADRDAVRIG
jgi:EmrB/QacA subfamily drug resistance transporter